jgi:hypothetical protein
VKTFIEELYQKKGDNWVGVWVHMLFKKTAGRQGKIGIAIEKGRGRKV